MALNSLLSTWCRVSRYDRARVQRRVDLQPDQADEHLVHLRTGPPVGRSRSHRQYPSPGHGPARPTSAANNPAPVASSTAPPNSSALPRRKVPGPASTLPLLPTWPPAPGNTSPVPAQPHRPRCPTMLMPPAGSGRQANEPCTWLRNDPEKPLNERRQPTTTTTTPHASPTSRHLGVLEDAHRKPVADIPAPEASPSSPRRSPRSPFGSSLRHCSASTCKSKWGPTRCGPSGRPPSWRAVCWRRWQRGGHWPCSNVSPPAPAPREPRPRWSRSWRAWRLRWLVAGVSMEKLTHRHGVRFLS